MKNQTKKLLSLILALVMILTIFPMQVQAAMKLSKTKLTLDVGKSVTLKVTGTSKKVTWSSNNKSVATVSSKGKVTAKQEGTAKITAKVGSKKLICTVNVKSTFSSKDAVKKVSCTYYDTGKEIIGIFKNNNSVAVSIEAKAVYYSESGKMLDTSSGSNYCLEANRECAIRFAPPYSSNLERMDYSSYKVTMSVEKVSHIKYDVSKISVKSDMSESGVTAEVTNDSNMDFDYIHLSIVYFDSSNNAIGHDERYAECNSSGSTDYVSFSFPYDSNYDTIIPNDYKIYVDYAYKYNW